MSNKSYISLENHLTEISNLGNILSIITWDYATNIPKNSATYRQEEITTLSSLKHRMFIDELTGSLIGKAQKHLLDLDEWQKSNLILTQKFYNQARCIDRKLQEKFTKYSNECEFIWRESKKSNDFKKVKPYLEKLLEIVREIADRKSQLLGLPIYDVLLDQYAPGTTSASIKKVLLELKEALPNLMQKIIEKQKSEIVLPLRKVNIDQQKLIANRIMQFMQFDLSKGRLDESAHPFCGGTPNDIRLTTRYKEDDFITGLMGVIHETGHALYEQNLPKQFSKQFVGKAMGVAFHESQSLIMEMQVARSREFIEFLARCLRDEFGFVGNEYEADNLYKLINRVFPDFIRVDADEVTYPLHVMIRFEIEEALIGGDLKLKDMPETWNKKMEQYLSITPNNYSEGCMQDIHWYKGMFGYFPSYTSGSIIASMLMKKAKETIPNLLNEIRDGNFSTLNNYLNQNFRNFGSLHKASKLLKLSTGDDDINAKTFITYLTHKYL